MDIINSLLSLLLFFVVLLSLVMIHELGHFLAAKWMEVGVKEFAFGFGPALWKRKIGETLYRFNWIPLGGFVSLEGEDGEQSSSATNYQNKLWYQKIVILVGGIVMNILMGLILMGIFLPLKGYQLQTVKLGSHSFIGASEVNMYMYVTEVVEGSVAKGLINKDDLIISINGEKFTNQDDFLATLKKYKNTEVSIRVQNTTVPGSAARDVKVTLPDKENAILGVRFMESVYEVNYPANILVSPIAHSINVVNYQVNVLGNLIGRSFAERDAGIVGEQVGSIVSLGVIIDDYFVDTSDFTGLLQLTAIVSFMLALFNLLPIPALDGGYVALVLVEAVTRRKVPFAWVAVVTQIFFLLLLALGIGLMIKDVIQFDLIARIFS